MQISEKELTIIDDELQKQIQLIFQSFKNRGIPICIAYAMLTNTGPLWISASMNYSAPEEWQAEKLFFEISNAVISGMNGKKEE